MLFIIHILFLMCENVSNDVAFLLIVAILNLTIAAIFWMNHMCLKSSVVNCAKIHTFITLYSSSSGILLNVDLR